MSDKTPETKITLIKGGPIIVKGPFQATNSDGSLVAVTAEQRAAGVAFCRCGKSKNQPFCDGSHAK